jgi:hypothetical protein
MHPPAATATAAAVTATAVRGQGGSSAGCLGNESIPVAIEQQAGGHVGSDESQQERQQFEQPPARSEVADETLQRYSQDDPAGPGSSSSRQTSGTQRPQVGRA